MNEDILKLATGLPDSLKNFVEKVPTVLSDSISVTIPDTLKVVNSVPFYKDATFYLSIITILIALLALFLPHAITKSLEKKKENVRLHELETYFFSILISLNEPINKQIGFFKELSEKIKDEESREIRFQENSDLYMQNLNEIKHQDLYTIFIQKKNLPLEEKVEHFKNIFHSLHYINSQVDRSKSNFITYFNDNRRYETEFRENVDQILRQWDQYLSFAKRNNVIPSQDALLKEFDAILQNWKNTDNMYSIKCAEDNLLDPLKKLCQEEVADPRTTELIRYVVDTKYAISYLRKMKGIYSKQFNNEAIELEKKQILLNQAIQFFKSSS